MFRKLLAMLPKVEILLTDYHLSVIVGEKVGESVGFTVGPHFLSFDRNGDIARQIVSPPKGYEGPMTDITLTWNTREGLVDCFVPEVRICNHTDPVQRENFDMWAQSRAPRPVSPLAVVKGDGWEDEEPEPSTIRTFPHFNEPRVSGF